MRYSPIDGVTAERSGERMVILDPDGSTLTTLNPVGTIVWEHLPGEFEALLGALREEFGDVPEETLTSDLHTFLAQLESTGLVVTSDAAD